MPVKKNEKGEYAPDITPSQIRYRQVDPEDCLPKSEGGYIFTKIIDRDYNLPIDTEHPQQFHRVKGLVIPNPPSYKENGKWNDRISVVVCVKKSDKKLAIQSIRESR